LRAGGTPTAESVEFQVNLVARATATKGQLPSAVLAPGDSVDRVLDLRGPSKARGSVTMTIVPVDGHTSLLDTDRVNGLQLLVSQCTGKNARFATDGGNEKCVRGHTKSLARLPLAAAEGPAIALRKIVLGPTMHLRLRLTFPHSAGNRFQDAASSLDFRFTVRVKPPHH
jgi:hypothetical protein